MMRRKSRCRFPVPAALIVVLFLGAYGQPYTDLVPKFNRATSNAMVREIGSPTLANLDYAAYANNPVRYSPGRFKPKAPPKKVSIADLTFSGLLISPCDSLEQTPLTRDEIAAPLAWAPLQNRLWEAVKSDALSRIGSAINGYKWADPTIYQPYQEIAAAYIHDNKGRTELWVRIDFAKWVNFLKGIAEPDHDGFKEIYGKLNIDSIDGPTKEKIFAWINGDYRRKVLTKDEIVDWGNVLASYWYPVMNTDIVDMTGEHSWPTGSTEPAVRKTMRNISVKNPVIVIRGKPFGKPIYNVFVVATNDSGKPDIPVAPFPHSAEGAPEAAAGVPDESVSDNFTENNARFDREIKQYGDYPAWTKKNGSFLDNVKKMIGALPPDQMAFRGRGDWLFFRKSIDYMTGGDLAAQPRDKNPIPNLVDFRNYLAKHNVNLLFVVVPNKEELYPEYLPVDSAPVNGPYVNPYSRKVLRDLQAAGIEVIDLLPRFLEAKKLDDSLKVSLYQHQDTHWTDRGLEIAAELIAERIKAYAWYKNLDKTTFTLVDTSFERQGDLVDKLPEAQRTTYPAVTLGARQVRMPDGTPYKGGASSPVMLIGDSFTGVFELVDCKSAGVGSHIAEKTGLPVDIITSWGGGPLVRRKAMRAREKFLPAKRLVVYMMVARDLYNYGESWEPFPGK